MDRDSIREFIRDIQGPNANLKDQGEWVMTSCPLAPWTHAHGTDNNVSFGIKVEDANVSRFSCFACHESGSLTYLLKELEYYTGVSYSTAMQMVGSNDYLSVNLPSWEATKVRKLPDLEPVDLSILELYESAVGHPYLDSRGIDESTAELLNLRVDPNNKGVERILFPVYGVDGNFYGFSGRATRKDVELKVRDYFGLKKDRLLLGAHLIDKRTSNFIILVEGLFDYAKMVSYGYQAVAAMHSTLTQHQAQILIKLGMPIVVFFDDDLAGKDGTQKVKQILGSHVPLSKVRYPSTINIRKPSSKSAAKESKLDPGSLTEQQVYDMLADRRVL